MTGPSVAALRRLADEATAVLERQLALLASIDEKASGVLRFNVLVVGLFLTAYGLSGVASAGFRISGLASGAVAVGLSLLVTSILFAVAAYQVVSRLLGVSAEALVRALQFDATEREVLRESILAHGDALVRNYRALNRAAFRLRIALWLVPAGIVLLAGALRSFITPGGPFP